MARHKINTPEGRAESEKFRKTMREKYGVDGIRKHYQTIGRKGGENGRGPNYTGGFAGDKLAAQRAGALGGMHSRRGLKFIKEEDGFFVYEDEMGGLIRYEKPNKN